MNPIQIGLEAELVEAGILEENKEFRGLKIRIDAYRQADAFSNIFKANRMLQRLLIVHKRTIPADYIAF